MIWRAADESLGASPTASMPCVSCILSLHCKKLQSAQRTAAMKHPDRKSHTVNIQINSSASQLVLLVLFLI